jgi:hypothetical protein
LLAGAGKKKIAGLVLAYNMCITPKLLGFKPLPPEKLPAGVFFPSSAMKIYFILREVRTS